MLPITVEVPQTPARPLTREERERNFKQRNLATFKRNDLIDLGDDEE